MKEPTNVFCTTFFIKFTTERKPNVLQKSRLVEKQVEVRDKMKVLVQKKQRKMPLVLNLPIKAFVLPGTTIIAKCGSNRLEFF